MYFFPCIISCYCLDEAACPFYMLERDASYPAGTFNALLEVCARTKDLERGYEVIERMERAGVLPDEHSVEAVKNRRALRTQLKRTFNL